MPNFFADAAASIADDLISFGASEVTYRRGNRSVTLSAVLGRKLLALSDESGAVRMQWTDQDFGIKAEDLTFDSGDTEAVPERGDTIELAVGSETWVYTVLPFGDEPLWNWADGHHVMRRIHTKLTRVIE